MKKLTTPHKLHRDILALLVISILTAVSATHASEDVVEHIGKLAIGLKSDRVIELLGVPEKKKKESLIILGSELGFDPEIRYWSQAWKYYVNEITTGMTLEMRRAKLGGDQIVAMIEVKEGCPLSTSRGIKIGSTVAEVRRAYGEQYNEDLSVPGETFVAGSQDAAVVFTFEEGKVTNIVIAAAQ